MWITWEMCGVGRDRTVCTAQVSPFCIARMPCFTIYIPRSSYSCLFWGISQSPGKSYICFTNKLGWRFGGRQRAVLSIWAHYGRSALGQGKYLRLKKGFVGSKLGKEPCKIKIAKFSIKVKQVCRPSFYPQYMSEDLGVTSGNVLSGAPSPTPTTNVPDYLWGKATIGRSLAQWVLPPPQSQPGSPSRTNKQIPCVCLVLWVFHICCVI